MVTSVAVAEMGSNGFFYLESQWSKVTLLSVVSVLSALALVTDNEGV
jgi:hypothetical protein